MYARPTLSEMLGWRFVVSVVGVGALYSALYWRCVSWGWLYFDDKALIQDNVHLGHWSWANVWWALTDTAFGRRWTPLMWLVAEIPNVKTAFAFHFLVFVLGLVLCGLLVVLFFRSFYWVTALLLGMVFVASPLRLEVFGWSMGFVYETTAIFCVLAFLVDGPWLALFWAVCGLLTYPQAAGCLLVVCWLYRRSWASRVGIVVLVLVALEQYHLRLHIGFIPMHYCFGSLLWTPCHYVLSFFFPYVTSPVFPAGFYPLLAVGGFVLAFWFGVHWRSAVVCMLVLSPVLAASITESFWFGARYDLLFEGACLWFVGVWISRCRVVFRTVVPLGLVVVLGSFLVLTDDIFAHGNLYALEDTVNQAETLGADCLVYKIVLRRLSPSEIAEVRRRPLLAGFLPSTYCDCDAWRHPEPYILHPAPQPFVTPVLMWFKRNHVAIIGF